MKRWHVVLGATVLAAVGIQLFFPHYNQLQMAKDAARFRHVLGVHPRRAGAATLCDIAFAVGYSLLGAIGVRAVGRSRASTFALVTILIGGLCDELENIQLLVNIVRRKVITDGSVIAMRVPGTIKWIGAPGFLVLFGLLVVRQRRARPAAPA